jgi:hypothetical protein
MAAPAGQSDDRHLRGRCLKFLKNIMVIQKTGTFRLENSVNAEFILKCRKLDRSEPGDTIKSY